MKKKKKERSYTAYTVTAKAVVTGTVWAMSEKEACRKAKDMDEWEGYCVKPSGDITAVALDEQERYAGDGTELDPVELYFSKYRIGGSKR